ncbi:MAG TPA: DUF4153 domain-containing protein, partial [Sphingomonadaceae bacterium]|nr:DUF4153 domain-containing protein [Sphingomonadaceae bacterium]
MSEERIAPEPTGSGGEWAERPWILAAMLGSAGLLIWLVTDGNDDVPWQMAAAAFLFFGPLSAAMALERERWKEVAIFALAAGLVMAGLDWRAVSGQDRFADEQYGFAAGVVATVIALPLFQAGFHRLRFSTPYRDIHFHVWTDAVSAAGSLAFVGLTWLMTLLLASLFQLLKIDFLMDLIEEGWFGWMLSGAAFGAALGVLRNKLGILHTLFSVVQLVLSLLAVPLALGLVVFLLAMVVSGPEVLWEATRSATPLLLACAVGAFVLTNAIVRDDDTGMTTNVLMRVTSLVLALTIFPLTIFAAVSMGTRVAAYGLSPERLWGLVAIAVATSYGIAYLVVVIRGRLKGWRVLLRQANMNLAAGQSVFALLLALPILNFGAISAANQLARLDRGVVAAEDFDFAALKWDFGDAGKAALEKLVASENAEIAKLAKEAEAMDFRPYGTTTLAERRTISENADLSQFDENTANALRAYLRDEIVLCRDGCRAELLRESDQGKLIALMTKSDYGLNPHLLLVKPGAEKAISQRVVKGRLVHEYEGLDGAPDVDGEVELRPFSGYRVYV